MMKTSSLLLHSSASLSPMPPSLHSYNCFLASKDVLKSLICCLILFILVGFYLFHRFIVI